MFKDFEGECNSYCIGVVKPILQQSKLVQFSELKDRIQSLQTLLTNTEQKLAEIQIKFGVCEDGAHMREMVSKEQVARKTKQLEEVQMKLKTQDESIRNLEKEISDQQGKMSVCSEVNRNKDVQYTQLVHLHEACVNSSKVKDELISSHRALVERNKSAGRADTIRIELKDRQITTMEEELKEKEFLLKEKTYNMSLLTTKFREQAERISECQEQLTKCQASSCVGLSSDIHVIGIPGIAPFPVLCDSTLVEGGWTVIQRRRDGSVSFNRNWTDYRIGFGDLRGDFFIGLQKIYMMTKYQQHELYIYLNDFNGEIRHASYSHFQISHENEFYKLKSLGEYKGTAGDALTSQKDMLFSTPDSDHDMSKNTNCAKEFRSGWWFRHCYLW